jgi:Holliday junction resolvase RusA-like endonuclease
MKIAFTVYAHPEPQGSTKAVVPPGWTRAVITSDNTALKSYRHVVGMAAVVAMRDAGQAMIPADAPVCLAVRFYLTKPPSVPKKRWAPVVKPDLDKLLRATFDALAGIVYARDQQIVSARADKVYGAPERVEIEVETIKQEEKPHAIAA